MKRVFRGRRVQIGSSYPSIPTSAWGSEAHEEVRAGLAWSAAAGEISLVEANERSALLPWAVDEYSPVEDDQVIKEEPGYAKQSFLGLAAVYGWQEPFRFRDVLLGEGVVNLAALRSGSN